MTLRRLASALLLAAALALIVVAVVPRGRVHRFLDARAGHQVSEWYVDAVRTRAAVCGGIMVVIAVLVLYVECGGHAAALTVPAMPAPALTILAIGALARALLLFGPPHYDEAFTVTEFASKSPLFFLTRYTHPNNHVFHTLLIWPIHLIAGNRLWALRLPAFLAGVAVIAATYLLARRVTTEGAACLAAALAAGATPLVEYSAQARGYTLLTLCFLLLYLIDDDRVRIVLLALAAWTMPTALYAAAAWAVWMALTQRAWRRIAAVAAGSAALAFLLYVPILVISGVDSIAANGNVLSVPYRTLVRELPQSLGETWVGWNLSFTIVGGVVLTLAAVLAILRRRHAAAPLAATLLAILPLLVLMRKVPFPRVWIFALPLYLIAAAGETPADQPARTPAILLALLLCANALRVTQRYDFVEDPALRDVPQIAETLRALPPDARVLVTSPLDAPFRLYAPERIVEDRFDSDPDAVRAAIAAAPRRYLVASTRPGGLQMADALHLPYARVETARFPNAVLFELRSP